MQRRDFGTWGIELPAGELAQWLLEGVVLSAAVQ